MRICNPKLWTEPRSWYPYYAGFSSRFARHILSSAKLTSGARVLDPWNGAGTTTGTAAGLGLVALGCDLNPAAVVIAKGRLVGREDLPSVAPLANDIIAKANERSSHLAMVDAEPLLRWFQRQSAGFIRCIEVAIRELLVGNGPTLHANQMSALAAFFYTALFRATRRLARNMLTSNPTWIRQDVPLNSRVRPGPEHIASTFEEEVDALARYLKFRVGPVSAELSLSSLQVASSERIPYSSQSVDFVLSSPPYCTRIDYAVATALELAVLGMSHERFRRLRTSLMGTCTVGHSAPAEIPDEWGITCHQFLSSLKAHPSKASATYYFKNHSQYFRSLANSIREIERVLKPRSSCVIVVQDSFYKDIHNDLAQIVSEIATIHGFKSVLKRQFPVPWTLAGVHPGARLYRSEFKATESVLCLTKSTY